jgi:hypothetical protein
MYRPSRWRSRLLASAALTLLVGTLVGCGAGADKGAAIRADEALYASITKPSGLHLERREQAPLTNETDFTFLQHTTGWQLVFNYKTRPDDPSADIDVVYDDVRKQLPSDWRCESTSPGGWCWSPDGTKSVSVDFPVNGAARAGDTVRIGVAIDTEETSEQPALSGYPAHR